MIKLMLMLFGVVTGAGATSAWLLSTPAPDIAAATPASLQDRLQVLQGHLNIARQNGARAQAEAENRVRHELTAFRQHPDRPGTSSRT